MTYYRHPLGWTCENSEQLTAELFVNRSTVGPINVGGRVLFPCDGERAGMFICLHVNEHSGGGVGRPLLEFRSCEAVRFVNTSAHGGTVLRASTYICIWWEEKKNPLVFLRSVSELCVCPLFEFKSLFMGLPLLQCPRMGPFPPLRRRFVVVVASLNFSRATSFQRDAVSLAGRLKLESERKSVTREENQTKGAPR